MLHLFMISLISFWHIFLIPSIDASNRVDPKCNHYFGQPITNECINQDVSNFPSSYKYQCTDENTMTQTYYQGLNCNESRAASNWTEECHGYDCYCGAMTNECEIAEVTVTFCNSSDITEQQEIKFVIDECLADIDNKSHILGCQQGRFYRLAYNTTDCSGDEYIEMNFPQDCQTQSPFDVAVICNSNETESHPTTTEEMLHTTEAEMFETTNEEIIETEMAGNCNFYQGFPINECMTDSQNASSGLYMKYNCIDESTLSTKYYASSDCNESGFQRSVTQECTSTDTCYCGGSNDECNVADLLWTNCSTPFNTANYKVVVNECLPITSDNFEYSFQYQCTVNGGLSGEYYSELGCSGELLFSFHYSHSCENATDGFIASCVERGETMTTEEPISTTASRLCERELMSQEYNNCGIFKYNGGCQEHDSLIFQSGTMSYSDCCAKCNEMKDCKSFSFGRSGVTSQNWCNIYSLECSDDGDKDWYMFTPINNVDAICDTMV